MILNVTLTPKKYRILLIDSYALITTPLIIIGCLEFKSTGKAIILWALSIFDTIQREILRT